MADAPPCCPHPPSDHGNDGCLHGWGTPDGHGCWCMTPGMADR